jgi:hypothetical protein
MSENNYQIKSSSNYKRACGFIPWALFISPLNPPKGEENVKY